MMVKMEISTTCSARNFGGCRRLASEYRAIGISLLRYEHNCSAMLLNTNSGRALHELRTDVASISTQTLESYLDDLVDVTLPLQELYLRRGALHLLSSVGIASLSLGIAALVGLVTMATDFPLATSIAAAPLILIASLFAISRHHTVRRLRFAHVIRAVISARRGSGTHIPIGHLMDAKSAFSAAA